MFKLVLDKEYITEIFSYVRYENSITTTKVTTSNSRISDLKENFQVNFPGSQQ